MNRTIVFDMDGTLVDSGAVVARTWQAFAQRHGIDAAAVLDFAHGRPTRETVEHFAGPGREAEVDAITATEASDVQGVVEIPGARALIDRLDPARWGVCTSASRGVALVRLRAAGLPVPRVLVTSESVARGKPDPEGYLLAAKLLGAQPSECVIFEDAEAGIRAALACGVAQVVVVGDYEAPWSIDLHRVRDLVNSSCLTTLLAAEPQNLTM